MSIDVKATIEENFHKTARGRQSLKGKEVKTEPGRVEKQDASFERSALYLRIARELRLGVENFAAGITFDELDAVDFAIEHLEATAKKACDTAIEEN